MRNVSEKGRTKFGIREVRVTEQSDIIGSAYERYRRSNSC